MYIQIEWSGLPDRSDSTWEPILQVEEDLPGMLEDFLETARERELKAMDSQQLYA